MLFCTDSHLDAVFCKMTTSYMRQTRAMREFIFAHRQLTLEHDSLLGKTPCFDLNDFWYFLAITFAIYHYYSS